MMSTPDVGTTWCQLAWSVKRGRPGGALCIDLVDQERQAALDVGAHLWRPAVRDRSCSSKHVCVRGYDPCRAITAAHMDGLLLGRSARSFARVVGWGGLMSQPLHPIINCWKHLTGGRAVACR